MTASLSTAHASDQKWMGMALTGCVSHSLVALLPPNGSESFDNIFSNVDFKPEESSHQSVGCQIASPVMLEDGGYAYSLENRKVPTS
jgi:hypothetical protein